MRPVAIIGLFLFLTSSRTVFADDARMRTMAGKTYLYGKKYKQAQEEFEAAIRLDPEYLEARMNLARLHEKMQEYTAAALQYRAILKVDPQYPGLKAALDKISFVVDDEAIDAVEASTAAATPLGPREYDLKLRQAEDLLAVGKFDETRDALDALLRMNPSEAALLVMYGKSLEKERRYSEAVTWYEKALRQRPADPEVVLPLIRIYSSVGEFARAKELGEAQLAIDPQNVELFLLMSRVALGLGDETASFRYMREAAALSPKNQVLQDQVAELARDVGLKDYNAGLLFFQNQEWAKARDSLTKAMEQGNLEPEESAIAQQFIIVASFNLAEVRDQIAVIQKEHANRERGFLEKRLRFDEVIRNPSIWKAGRQVDFDGWVVAVENKDDGAVLLVSTDRNDVTDNNASSDTSRRVDDIDVLPNLSGASITGPRGAVLQPGQTFRANVEMTKWFTAKVPRPLPQDSRIRSNSIVRVLGTLKEPKLLRNPWTRAYSRYAQPMVAVSGLEFRREDQIRDPIRGGLGNSGRGPDRSRGGVESNRSPIDRGFDTPPGVAGPLILDFLELDPVQKKNALPRQP